MRLLDRLTPDLVKEGLLTAQDESWVESTYKRCDEKTILSSSLPMYTLFALMHRNAIDFLEQAPILMWYRSDIDIQIHSNRMWWCRDLHALLKKPEARKLKGLMKLLGIPYPLRKLSLTTVACSGIGSVYLELAQVNPSYLSQHIPFDADGSIMASAQKDWASAVRFFIEETRLHFLEGVPGLLEWWIQHAVNGYPNPDPIGASELVDYLRAVGTFNVNWSYQRAHREIGTWHAEVAQQKFLDACTVEVDYTRTMLPNNAVKIEEFWFVPLKSERALHEESQVMHHCVHTYYERVASYKTFIFSIRRHATNVATLELALPRAMASNWIRQLKGPFNKSVNDDIVYAAHAFCRNIEQGKYQDDGTGTAEDGQSAEGVPPSDDGQSTNVCP